VSTVADVFRRAAARQKDALDAYFASLITAEDRRHFLEAARVISALDDETKRLTKRKRAALKNQPIETAKQESDLVAALRQSLVRVLDVPPPAASNPDSIEVAGYVLRMLLVNLISKGFRGAKDRNTLLAATAAVSKLGAEAKHSDTQKWGRMSSRPPSKNQKSAALVARLRAKARTLLQTAGHLSQSARARILNAHLGQMWPSERALIECARRNGFSV
jgi:hypothetical protein